MCDIEKGALDKAVAELKQTNADVDGVVADVSLKSELQAAADATIARYGEVHIVDNNAGVAGGGGYGAWTDARLELDHRRQPDGGDLGRRDLRPADRAPRPGRPHRQHRLDRRADLGQRQRLQRHQVRRRGAVGGPAGRPGAARHRRFGAVPGLHPHQHRQLRRATCPTVSPTRAAAPTDRPKADSRELAGQRARADRSAASTRSTSANWCARGSRTTGPTSSPTTSSSRSSRCVSPASRPASTASAGANRAGEGRPRQAPGLAAVR